MNKVLRWSIILGFTLQGKRVTLVDCLELTTHLNFPGMPTSKIVSNLLFVGAHFNTEDSILFDAMSASYSLLDEWLDISGFEIEHLWKEKELLLKYRLPKKIEVPVNDSYVLSFEFTANKPLFPRTEAIIKQQSHIKIKPSEEKPLYFYDYIFHNLQNLLSLATMKTVNPLSFIASKGTDRPQTIDVYFRNPHYVQDKQKPHTQSDMLFTFHDIKENLVNHLVTWLNKAKLLQPVHNLYFGALYNPRMYIEHRFLSLCQAVEAYHRRIYSGTYQETDEYRKNLYPLLLSAIPDGIEKGFRDSIKARLTYLNEYSLRKRFAQILKQYNTLAQPIIPNLNEFTEDVINTRNFLTHYDKDLDTRAKKGEELYILTERLKFVLELCFLSEFGFKTEEVEMLIRRTNRYNYLKMKRNA
jgi:hypothetical protein